jgi:hypothetical protein
MFSRLRVAITIEGPATYFTKATKFQSPCVKPEAPLITGKSTFADPEQSEEEAQRADVARPVAGEDHRREEQAAEEVRGGHPPYCRSEGRLVGNVTVDSSVALTTESWIYGRLKTRGRL